jgi:hypothetical protein
MFDWSAISSAVTAAGDFCFGWLLALPRDAAIVALATLTSLVLALARKGCTNQGLLARCAADLRRLKQLIRAAKAGNEPARRAADVQRMRGTINLIKLKQLAAEGRVLLAALLPLAFLAVWGTQRLEYLPPAPGQELRLRAYYPLSSVDKLTHVAPPPGIELAAGSSAVQQVRLDDDGANGVAEWVLTTRGPVGPSELPVRHEGRSVLHRLRVDGRAYEPPLQAHPDAPVLATQVALTPARFAGVVPGLPALGLAPWVVAYLLLALALVFPLRKLLWVK